MEAVRGLFFDGINRIYRMRFREFCSIAVELVLFAFNYLTGETIYIHFHALFFM